MGMLLRRHGTLVNKEEKKEVAEKPATPTKASKKKATK